MEKLKILNLNFSFQRAAHYHINGGMLLMGVVLLAMFLANSPWGDIYASFWNYEVHLQIGEFNFFSHNGHHMTLMTFINDALMAVFFFSVGLEIKREILVGELSSFRQALLPIVAACGGMLVPVLIYYFMTAGTPAQSGLAIPMATDIAFSLGVLSLFGKRVPLSLKVFLTAFAVVDDIGGILVIALFYTSHLSVNYLIASAGILLILCGGNFFRVRNRWFYIFWGVIMWYLFLQSGIHATIAGVVAAFTVPATPHYKIGKYINRIRENIAVFPASGQGKCCVKQDADQCAEKHRVFLGPCHISLAVIGRQSAWNGELYYSSLVRLCQCGCLAHGGSWRSGSGDGYLGGAGGIAGG